MSSLPEISIDVCIIGGGAAGLWTLDELVRNGYQAILVEKDELGRGQTVCSQGIIHGGLKYTLDGLMNPSADTISAMPAIWRDCLAGKRNPDLTNTRVRADFCYLWRTQSLKSKLGMIGASVGLRVKPEKLSQADRPQILTNCPGVVTKLAEQVIDPTSLLQNLADMHNDRLIGHVSSISVDSSDSESNSIVLNDPDGNSIARVNAKYIVLTAGAGNETLAETFEVQTVKAQKRPLHMVMVRGSLPHLSGHCVDGAKTRATITSDVDSKGRIVWLVGGQLSEGGVSMDSNQLIKHAKVELAAILPDQSFEECEWSTFRVDRAEPLSKSGKRPENIFAKREGNIVVAWPVKLALVPRLAEEIVNLLDKPPDSSNADLSCLSNCIRPAVAKPPWETEQQWIKIS